jgi:hypothetical protein
MKTWKKIEDTRKRTNEITSLKNRNEERIRAVSIIINSQTFVVFRKNERCRRKLSTRGTSQPRTTWFRSRELKRSARYRKLST